MDDKLTQLVNAEMDLLIGGKIYKVRKANLEKGLLFRLKIKELSKTPDDGGNDFRLATYALSLVIGEPSITEESLMADLPADLNVQALLIQLGFFKDPVEKL